MSARSIMVAVLLAVMLTAFIPAAATGAPPVITVAFTGTAGENGWYVSAVTVKFTISGEMSSNGCDTVTLTADGVRTLHCTATAADSSTSSSDPIVKIDRTPPAVTSANPDRGANPNGWYSAGLTVSFGGSDATSGLASCQQASYSGPDTGGGAVSGTCRDLAGNVSAAGSFSFKYDATPPSVTPAPARAPDANGWYNHAVAVAFNGSDGTSGVESCGSANYGGPDSPGTSVSATCTDKAGNSATGTFTLKYDATPPQLGGLSFTPGNKLLQFRWQVSPDTAAITISRLAQKRGGANVVIYRGKAAHAFTDKKLTNGVRYKYSITSIDEAGNSATIAGSAAPTALFFPRDGEKIDKPPMLAWAAVKGASYYNVQLFRGSKKILSIWPQTTKLQLERRWTYLRTRYKLAAGRYRWYVWPGYGARKANRYGKLVGGSTFVVVR
jgi:hypothetical protein